MKRAPDDGPARVRARLVSTEDGYHVADVTIRVAVDTKPLDPPAGAPGFGKPPFTGLFGASFPDGEDDGDVDDWWGGYVRVTPEGRLSPELMPGGALGAADGHGVDLCYSTDPSRAVPFRVQLVEALNAAIFDRPVTEAEALQITVDVAVARALDELADAGAVHVDDLRAAAAARRANAARIDAEAMARSVPDPDAPQGGDA